MTEDVKRAVLEAYTQLNRALYELDRESNRSGKKRRPFLFGIISTTELIYSIFLGVSIASLVLAIVALVAS